MVDAGGRSMRKTCEFCGREIAVRGGRFVYHLNGRMSCEGTSSEPERVHREALLRTDRVEAMTVDELAACVDERLLDGSGQTGWPGDKFGPAALEELRSRARAWAETTYGGQA